MDNKIAWDDLQLILAIIREGTLSNAGKRLGMSYATVHRRLGQIETRIGVTLFNRSRSGNTPTLAGEELAATARQIENQVQEVERRIVGRDLQPTGTVRVATLDSLLVGILSPIFVTFQRRHQEISLDVVVSNQRHSLSKREADVAIRPSAAPNEALVGRKIARLSYAAYGAKNIVPNDRDSIDLHAFDWLGPDDAMVYPELEGWMRKQKLEAHCRYRINSVLAMQAAVADGQGIAVLPCYLGDADQRLARVTNTLPDLEVDLWLLTHNDLRKTGRVRALLDFVATAVKPQRDWLTGVRDNI
jgi:DNA-binding transcriptional LysR family regulator